MLSEHALAPRIVQSGPRRPASPPEESPRPDQRSDNRPSGGRSPLLPHWPDKNSRRRAGAPTNIPRDWQSRWRRLLGLLSCSYPRRQKRAKFAGVFSAYWRMRAPVIMQGRNCDTDHVHADAPILLSVIIAVHVSRCAVSMTSLAESTRRPRHGVR